MEGSQFHFVGRDWALGVRNFFGGELITPQQIMVGLLRLQKKDWIHLDYVWLSASYCKKIRGNYFASATFVVLLVTCSKEFYQNIDIFHELQVDTFITNLNIIIFWVLHNDKFLSTIWHNYLIHASDQCIMGKSKAKSSTVGFRMMHCKPV